MVRLLRFSILTACVFSTVSAFAAGGACPSGANYLNPANPAGPMVTLSSLGVSSCYYASKSIGSDTAYDGTQETVSGAHGPFAHIPGMTGCASNCASVTPAGGQGFIMRGGDTWTNSDLGDVWVWGGSSGAPIYVGVDLDWYSGSAWVRPVWTCGGSACTGTANYGNFWYPVGSYVTLDDIEMTGLYTSGAGQYPSYVATQCDHEIVERSYFHNWKIAGGATQDFGQVTAFDNNNFSPYTSVGSGLFYSVIDGSDASEPSMVAIGGMPDYVVGNFIQDVTNGLEGSATYVHDNYITNINVSYQAAAHQNAIQIQGLANGGESVGLIYNNVVSNIGAGLIVKYWWAQDADNAGTTWYVFNNVLSNVVSGNNIDICQMGSSCGTHYVFNNTWECGNSSGLGGCSAGTLTSAAVIYFTNNHCITSLSGSCAALSGTVTFTETTDLAQTLAQANANTSPHYDQYTPSQVPYAFSPVAGTNSTVAAGTNVQSYCTAIGNTSALAETACQYATGYACFYSTSNHAITCPSPTKATRPATASATWDIGAYQFRNGPQSGTNLIATPAP